MARAAGLAHLHGAVDDGYSGLLLFVGHIDALLDFEATAPPCHGFEAVDMAFLAVVALIAIAVLRFRHASAGKKLDLARKMIEQGMEPPQALLGVRAGNDLRRGLVLMFMGVGFLAASYLGDGDELSPAGLIPGFIGLGYLASHRFATRRPREESS